MTEPISSLSLSRRDFIKLAFAAGVTAIAGSLLYTYTPWLNYDQQTTQIRKPMENISGQADKMKELIRYATLAPNGHNAQAWKFLYNASGIQIHPDASRRLPAVDPQERELWISLGCALENLLVSARASGFTAEVTYPELVDFIDVKLASGSPQSSFAFDAIPLRQVNRSEYNGQPIPAGDLNQLEALPREPGIIVQTITGRPGIETAIEYLNQGNISQYSDTAYKDELIDWLRFNKREALTRLDGLFTRCTGNPEVPRWLGKLFVSGTNPQGQADADAKKVRSSAGLILIASESDDKSAWVRTGQFYERLALKMTSLNIKSALLNQPNEVSEVRPQFQKAMGLGTALPQLLVRFGYAELMPWSLRRPVEQVAIQI